MEYSKDRDPSVKVTWRNLMYAFSQVRLITSPSFLCPTTCKLLTWTTVVHGVCTLLLSAC